MWRPLNHPRLPWRSALLFLAFGALAAPARAERLPIKIYTTADGLASSVILDIVSDSRGFLWFATRNGLSRFDGSEFRTYTTDDGLSNPVVNRFLETSDGDYWVATNGGGVCRFNIEARAGTPGSSTAAAGPGQRAPLFTCYSVGDNFLSNRVNVLYEDRRRRIWMGTDNGVFRLERTDGAWHADPVVVEGLPAGTETASRALYEDSEGRLWVGLTHGFLRLDPDRRPTLYAVRGRGTHNVSQIIEHDGALWLGLNFGLLAFRPERQLAESNVQRTLLNPVRACFGPDGAASPVPTAAGEACLSDARGDLPNDFVEAFARAPNGRLWIATRHGGLAYLEGTKLTSLSTAASLAAVTVSRLALDRQGQLWIATYAGAMKLAPDGLVTYGPDDGLGHPRIRTLLEQAGQLFAVSGDWIVNRFDGRRFEAMKPRIPEGATFGYYSHGAFLDRSGRWWLLTDRGLYRLKSGASLEHSARQPPEAVYSSRHGLPDDRVERLFEDSRGDIWIATRSRDALNLSRWERTTAMVRTFREGFGPEHKFPLAFTEDAHGAVWVGFEGGGLARYHDGRFAIFGASDGVPPGVMALHVDRSGRLWMASSSAGLSLLRDVAASLPRFERYTTAEGLSSNNIQCMTEDRWGRIYLGTSRGIDRLDPVTRRVKHFTTSDGLASDYVTAALRDSNGTLWFGTNDGVSRLVPVPDAPVPAPPIWIGEVRAGGALLPISELGATALADLTLASGQNHLQITFFGVGFGTGRPLRYRYRLDGAEAEWTGPTDQRVVHYANLAPGRYRFIAEAVNADGIVSERPATVSFAVLPPFWQRWWFMSLAVLAIGAGLYSAYRYRLRQLLALERVRTRIAADLHDDIGGSLSRIAIQSEVARRTAGDAAGISARTLTQIGDTARTLVDALDDVVWSVDPRQDDLASVERRVREYAADVLGARGVRWTFNSAGDLDRVSLDPESRRHLLLLLKEGITNVARHAAARAAQLDLRVSGGTLHAELNDDGQGFDPAVAEAAAGTMGRGLANMRARARQLGGRLDILSAPGRGTRLILTAPVQRRRMFMRLWEGRR
ncbi:MAG: two-component regulator propeller domain-containing protein [Vicinamibacterales bacterium]